LAPRRCVVTPRHDLAVPPRSFTPGRDPWRFGEIPPPPPQPPPPPPTAAELAARTAAEQAAARPRAEAERLAEIERNTPKPPPFTLKYLGYFGPANARIAVFSDDKGAVYNVREGGEFQGKFILARIGYESVDIKFV